MGVLQLTHQFCTSLGRLLLGPELCGGDDRGAEGKLQGRNIRNMSN